ncbi:hypothetical protein [Actinophytocola glycyrrhizae]|uniref:CcmD family protein n=1 Tax=Actinophytocola glycyrrhizae TaxID=2044873 RepID=A0ABV9S4Z9_9PSEU
MAALTITIGAAVLVVLVFYTVRALRRASRRIDRILDEELDRPEED